MKQSTKLLSLVLALVMAFSCMTVIGNAALVKTEVKWDCIDDADLTAEQVADLALDLVDNDLLADMDTIDLSIIGELRLNKIDYIFQDIVSLRGGFVWSIGSGLLKNLGAMDFAPLNKGGNSWGTAGIGGNKDPYQRDDGDLVIIGQLLQFIGNDNNSEILSRIAYGMGDSGTLNSNGDLNNTCQLNLGLINSFLDLGEIGDVLNDLPGFLKKMVFDLLIYGSYGYDKDAEELGGTLPTEMNTLDKMVNNALLNLLINPQAYEWEGEGEAAVKIWDMKSIISPSFAAYVNANGRDAAIGNITPLNNSLFTILDFIAQFAIDDVAINALNNNLKKALMLAVEAELNEIDVESLPADVAAAFEVNTPEENKSYVTYIAYDKIAKSGNAWYYTTLEREVEEDPTTGDPVTDEEGNEVSVKVRKYFKVNMAAGNDFGKLINWNWDFVGSDVEPAEGQTQLLYSDITSNGSIASGINDLIGLVYEQGLTEAAKAEFEELTGDGWLEGNENINDNVVRVTKYILANFGDKVFGSDSAYANFTWEDLEPLSIVEMVALIGPEFFEDAMPQILLPKNADGTYAFHEGVQIWEFAAVVLRELITGIAPNVNYDAYIFENGDVTSADDRLFVEQDAEDWFNILLNMGIDLGCEYLINITNFRDYVAEIYGADFDLDDYIRDGKGGTDGAHWQAILDAAILWAVDYVGSTRSTSVLHGLDYNTVSGIAGPINKLSYILNEILPLGFICGYSSADYALDLELVVEGIKLLLTDFDLNVILNLFGRNADAYNFLQDVPLVQGVLDLVNSIVSLVITRDEGINLLQATNAKSVDQVLVQANLKKTVAYLLRQLYKSKDALLNNALPVVGKLIKGWGTEQAFEVPEISLDRTIVLNGGATSEAQKVTIRNASAGVWRHYRDAAGNEYTDNQYQIKPVSVAAYNYDGSTSSYVTTTGLTTTNIDYGQSGSFSFNVSGVPAAGAIVRFDVKYEVIDEDGNAMAGGKDFLVRAYSWLNHNPAADGQTADTGEQGISKQQTHVYYDFYINNDPEAFETAITNTAASWTKREDSFLNGSATIGASPDTATKNGITYPNSKRKESNAIEGETSYFSISNLSTALAYAATPGNKITWSVQAFANSSSASFTQAVNMYFYDGASLNKLSPLVNNEMSKVRMMSDYNLTGTAYADKILTTANTTDEDGNIIYRESNYSTLAWIDADENVYAEASVSDIVEEKDEDDNVIAASGKVTVGDKDILVKKVTAIDCASATTAYNNALKAAIPGACQVWNAQSVFNHKALYEALYVAANDMDYCRKTTEQIVAEGNADNIDGAVAALIEKLDEVEAQYTDNYNFTDYQMFRLNRLNDAREDASYYIQLQEDASPATVDEIDEYFDYNWMEEDDFRELVNGDPKEAMLLTLLEKFEDEEIEDKAEWLKAKKLEYDSTALLDVEMTSNLLTRTSQRLLNRKYGVITVQLEDEITSANNMIGTDASLYTAKSWARYQEKLQYANDVLSGAEIKSQKHIFDAKYQLILARKALVPADMEADYTELEALIAQAQNALANQNLYDNELFDFARVLAELGYNEIDDVQLFPGSALLVLEEGYHVDDQNKVDNAADALKEALARLVFKNTAITGNGVNVSNSVLVEGDEEKGIEEVVATTATIAECLNADAVKTLFTVTADNATVGADNITVSNDLYYTIDTDLEGFAGTNAVVTFYTVNNGVKIPVATIRIIVKGDINGDGVVDALDGAYAALVEAEKTELEGCYLLAGDLSNNDRVLNAADYTEIVNLVVD